MAADPTTHPDVALKLALAVVSSSAAPLLLLDGDLSVIAASMSFGRTFQIDPAGVSGSQIFELGSGEWNVPRLHSLLDATASGVAQIDAYEMDLKSERLGVRHLVLTARRLDYGAAEPIRLLLTVSDVTEVRAHEKLKDDLLREKAVLLQEVQHRVANSLQIISSVILQSARRTQSEEARSYLHAANDRVMSIAEVQRQLASSTLGEVALRPYFTQLCQSLGASMIRDQHPLTLEVRIDDRAVNADVSVSLGLIVTELVINALKHAFPDRRPGTITVGYAANGADWTLSVRDDGVGMPKDPATARSGLGTSIVDALARQLGARVQVSAGDPGATISIVYVQDAAARAATAPTLQPA